MRNEKNLIERIKILRPLRISVTLLQWPHYGCLLKLKLARKYYAHNACMVIAEMHGLHSLHRYKAISGNERS